MPQRHLLPMLRACGKRMAALALLGILVGCQLVGDDQNIDTVLSPTDADVVEKNKGDETLDENKPKVTFDSQRKADPQSKIGAAQHPKILASYGGAYENENLERVLALITGRLVAQSADTNRAYNITVLNSPTVNAFALPGGYLYITRGLLALASDSSEVAAVLAHEMAHVSSNHGIDRARATRAVSLADRVANNVVTNPVAGRLAKASTSRRLAAFSQKQELEADAVGIKMAGLAGFDPYAGARFLESMDRFAAWRSAQNTQGQVQDMSSSHPSTPRRIELARRHARAFGPEGSGERNKERYLKGIDGLLFGEKASDGYVRGQTFAHTKLAIKFSVPEGFQLKNQATSVLANGPNQQALRFDAVPVRGESGNVATYLKSGWVNGLLEQSVQSGTVNGLPMATGRAEAGDWQFSVTAVKAGKRYYRFIFAAPRSDNQAQRVGREIWNTFKQLSKKEAALLKPWRIRIAQASREDSVAKFARQMGDIAKAEILFRALNELGPKDEVKPGTLVKVIR